MKSYSSFHHHIHTNLLAKIVYLLCCAILVVAGIFGIYLTYNLADRYYLYIQRNQTAIATVTDRYSVMDQNYDYELCHISYKFTVNGKEYSSHTSPERITPTNYNCNGKIGDAIKIRYEAKHPANNTYGDNTASNHELLIYTVMFGILSILPLGFGFIGIVALQNSRSQEKELIAEESRHYYHRQAKTPEPRNRK